MSFVDNYGISTGPSPDFPAADTSGGSSGSSFGSPLSLGSLALGGAGFASILGQGESPLPPEFSQLTGTVPGLQAEAAGLEGQGASMLPGAQALTQQGTATLQSAAAGQLTPAQQAQLDQYRTSLTNQSRQMFASMGRNPDQDTAFITQTADNDAKLNAMAQQEIQSSIQLGLGQLSAGAQGTGQALGFEQAGLGFTNAANNALIQAGEAQVKQDQAYSSSLTQAFTAIGSMFGTAVKAAAL